MTNEMHYGADYGKLPPYSLEAGEGIEVRPDLYLFTDQIANVVFIGNPENSEFVLVDTGLPHRSKALIKAAKERFGEQARAKAIIITHGHFDHVGSVLELIAEWNAPVYAHPSEFPFLTGEMAYPEADEPIFPTGAVNIGHHLRSLPENGDVPELPDFEWRHVPGHTPGHIVLFRAEDRVLISGDAFVTTKKDYFFANKVDKVVFSGPPKFLTPDWEEAGESVRKLQQLHPKCVISGHGYPVESAELTEGLSELVENWNKETAPVHERTL